MAKKEWEESVLAKRKHWSAQGGYKSMFRGKSYYPMTYGENLCSTEILFDLILLIINCHILLEINNVLK